MPQEKSCFIKSNLNHFLPVDIDTTLSLLGRENASSHVDTNMKGLIEHVLPETCYKKGVNFRYREDQKRYNNSTLRACYDKCKGGC